MPRINLFCCGLLGDAEGGGFLGWVGCSSQVAGERIPGRISPLGMIQKSSTATVGVVTTAG
ncbi:MAG: hypothetical protein ACK58H_11180, partial [Planctomyces sp.]